MIMLNTVALYNQYNPNLFLIGEGFGFFVYLKNSKQKSKSGGIVNDTAAFLRWIDVLEGPAQ